MSININANFLLQSKLFLDSRKSFDTIADMASFLEGAIPEGFITYCKETDKYYKFNNANTVDVDLGKWREFSSGGGDVIDDTLETSLTKTYSIDKIKELMSKQGGVVVVDTLPDLTDPLVRVDIEINKTYLVPNTGTEPNAKDEYVCIFTEGKQAVTRVPLVDVESDYTTYITEITDYVTNSGGTLADDYATYITVKNTTAMTETIYNEMIESINNSDTDFSAYTTRVSSEVITPATNETWVWEKIGTRDGGSLEWGEDIIVNNPMGKVTDGTNLNGQTVLDIVAKMLTKSKLATIELKGNPDISNVFEKGVASITDVALTAVIDLGTCTIADGTPITFKKNGVAIGTETFVDGTLTYSFTETGVNLEDDAKYSVDVEFNNEGVSGVARDEIKYEFEYPIFYGVSATKTIADITALTKVVSAENKQTFSYTGTNSYCVIAIPDVKTISNIKDQNQFDNTSSFSYVTQVVTLGTNSVVYKVYTNDMPVTCSNFKYSFQLA